MSRRQRRTRGKRRRHAAPTGKRVRAATITGSVAATAAIGLAASGEPATAAGGFDAALVQDIDASDNGDPNALAEFGGTLFFAAYDGPDDGATHGMELWRSDGTTAGTHLVADINTSGDSSPYRLTTAGGYLFFVANDGMHGYELWKTDGTEPGTEMVQDIDTNGSDSSDPDDLTEVGGILLFTAYDGPDDGTTYGRELWRSDGDPSGSGTYMVEDIYAGSSSYPDGLTDIGGTLFFTAADGPDPGTGPPSGRELWKSGTTAGSASLVEDINTAGDSNPNHITDLGGGVALFAATGDTHGQELWRSDGTDGAGTYEVKDINATSATAASNPKNFENVGGTVFFSATDGADVGVGPPDGEELWKSDGTPGGTQLVKDIFPTAGGNANPDELTDFGGTLFFTARDSGSNYELWRSDGSPANTYMVKDINPGTGNANPTRLTPVGGNLFFSANDGSAGEELWRSDGTDPGTALVRDIRAGSYGSDSNDLTVLGDTLFFSADDGPDNGTTHGRELWRAFAVPPPGPTPAPTPAPTTLAPTFNLKAAIRKCKKKFAKGPKRKKCIKKAKAKAGV